MAVDQWRGVCMWIVWILSMCALVNSEGKQLSSLQRFLQRLGDLETRLESVLKHLRDTTNERLDILEERVNKETRYRRQDLHFLQEQIDRLAVSNPTGQKCDKGNGKVFNENKADLCDRIERAFQNLKSDLYTKLENTAQRVSNVEEIVRTYDDLRVNLMKVIQKQLSESEDSNGGVLQVMKTISDKMHSEIASFSKRFDNYTLEFAEKLEEFEKKLPYCEETTVEEAIETDKVPSSSSKPKSCRETTKHGVVTIYPRFKQDGLQVLCDQQTDGGGWIIFQRRMDGSVDFYRDWKTYEDGFGSVKGEFWLGNKFLHLFTVNVRTELRIDLKDFEGNSAMAHYSDFHIGPPFDKYRLRVGEYTGTAGNGLLSDRGTFYVQEGEQFSTFDSDNDRNVIQSCAELFHGAWWFNDCFDAHLNGEYVESKEKHRNWTGIIWYPWKGKKYSLKSVEMKFRYSV